MAQGLSVTPGAGASLGGNDYGGGFVQFVYSHDVSRVPIVATQIGLSTTATGLGAPPASAMYAILRPNPGPALRWFSVFGATVSPTWGILLAGGSVPEAIELRGSAQMAGFKACLNTGETTAGRLNVEYGYFAL